MFSIFQCIRSSPISIFQLNSQFSDILVVFAFHFLALSFMLYSEVIKHGEGKINIMNHTQMNQEREACGGITPQDKNLDDTGGN